MTAASRYRGQPVSDGTAVGEVYLGDGPGTRRVRATATVEQVRVAFAAVAHDRAELARQLRDKGRDHDAGIVEIGALIAADPALTGPVLDAVRGGADAVAAIEEKAEAQAALLAALPDPDLAQRAGDVRQVASAVTGYLSGNSVPPPPAGSFILVRREVDPADLIRLAEAGLAGAVSVSGGASSHAAIIARGLGLPMLAGADPRVLAAEPGHPAILDTADGALTVDPRHPNSPPRGPGPGPWRRPVPHQPTSAPPTASRSPCCAMSPPRPRRGLACPAGRPASACCVPRSRSRAPPAGRRRRITSPSSRRSSSS
jgi:phosphoenolpyruvate-protein kinase (PTS system EI component)